MPWWRKDTNEEIAAKLDHEERRKYRLELKQQNDATAAKRSYEEGKAWQRQSFISRKAPEPVFWPRKDDDGIVLRNMKKVVNDEVHDHKISWRRWQYEREEKRQEKATQQARPHPPSGSGAGTADNPFIMGDESKRRWRLFGQGAPSPEPAPQRSRGRGR
jgi:hypothetical protein